MENSLLPLGSVVKLKKLEKNIMITGFLCTKENDTKKVYDYSACLYPEGILSSNKNILFNHEDIEQVIYLGLSDIEEKEFKKSLLKRKEEITDEYK